MRTKEEVIQDIIKNEADRALCKELQGKVDEMEAALKALKNQIIPIDFCFRQDFYSELGEIVAKEMLELKSL